MPLIFFSLPPISLFIDRWLKQINKYMFFLGLRFCAFFFFYPLSSILPSSAGCQLRIYLYNLFIKPKHTFFIILNPKLSVVCSIFLKEDPTIQTDERYHTPYLPKRDRIRAHIYTYIYIRDESAKVHWTTLNWLKKKIIIIKKRISKSKVGGNMIKRST